MPKSLYIPLDMRIILIMDITYTKQNHIDFAYLELSDDDKIQVDIQVKRILDRFAAINEGRVGQKFQMSRSMALELLYSLGRSMQGKVNHE